MFITVIALSQPSSSTARDRTLSIGNVAPINVDGFIKKTDGAFALLEDGTSYIENRTVSIVERNEKRLSR